MSSIYAQTSVIDQLSLFFNNDLQFIQSSLNTITNTIDRTEGEYSRKNNLIIINVTSPYKENYYINDKKIGVKETNLISEKIYIDSKLDKGRNKISIIAIDRNDFKTAKNFYITRDET